jgi:Zn-dependent protease with chaperone function
MLYSMIFSSIFLWTFLGASLVVCAIFLGQYREGQDWILQLVFGGALLISLSVSSAMLLVAQRYAVPMAISRMMRTASPASNLSKSFEGLMTKMNVRADLAEAIVGSAFSASLGGRNVVAVSSEIVDSLSSEEIEAVLAHELSHIKNHDGVAKGLARLGRLAFPFDPVLRLEEAAVHRERELMADQESAGYTGKPLALASALLKACQTPSATIYTPLAGLCVGGSRKGWSALFSLYPDLERRVELLVNMARHGGIEQPLQVA